MTPQRLSCLHLVAHLFLTQHFGMTANSAYGQDVQIRYTHTILMYSALSAATRARSRGRTDAMCSPVSRQLHALIEYTDTCGYLSSSEEGCGHPPFSTSHAMPPFLLALQAGIPHLRCYRVMLIEVNGSSL